MVNPKYTPKEKAEECERECAMRIRHYPGLVARGSLSTEIARRRIQIMKEIADDYRAQFAPTLNV